ncbi:hypothetical protein FRZ67_08665 [Panacibacter ginsenosidivorans]|uniref:Uncharacterized protein n=1 Tax=Panacibacter ginsenosidivorans TaxID=1813871 RepID=A0A5B8V8X0_9BACT|nr:DUF5995 family protein [Panacibacter ginsenosidivorans]QEC67363.1 hypothetical protein FRZ67_08665 [Panacibacter ginsenosidivorans]
MQTINDVVIRLDATVQQCIHTKNRAGYFAALYKRMTAAVAEGIQQHAFEDGPRMERLDVIFAKRYTDAYDAYYSGKPCSSSWKLVFDCCNNNNLTVIQHLLLGINTHINLDLAVAAALTCPGNSINALQHDFNKINDVINSLVDDVQESLCRVWWPMRMITKIANGRQEAVLNFSIDKARDASWASALLLAGMTAEQQQVYVQQMDIVVQRLGTGIESPGILSHYLLQTIRAIEYDDVAQVINIIDTTVA